MDVNEFGWKYCEEEVDEKRVAEIEETLLIKLPEDYKTCAKKFHGGSPRRRKFSFHDKHGRVSSLLGGLLSLHQGSPEYIVDITNFMREQGVERLVPFATNGGGDYICFDYRNINDFEEPKIVYWNHEETGSDAILFLSNSFEEFLRMLSE